MADEKGLTLSQMLEADDMQPVPVDAPEWGGTVYVLPLTGTQRDMWDQLGINASQKGGSLAGIRSKLLQWSLCDAKGSRLNPTGEHVKKLGDKNGAVVERIACRVLEISGLKEPEKNEGS